MTRCTVKGEEPTMPASSPAPTAERLADGQHADHWAMCPTELMTTPTKRPVRRDYLHSICGGVTTAPVQCAETMARDPSYYTSTFCCTCRSYFSIGAAGNFTWCDDGTKVGT